MFILTVGSLCLSSFTGKAPRQTPMPDLTPTPTVMRSLFKDDICTPPCWFGLVPGKSTSVEVEETLTNFDELLSWDKDYLNNSFDPKTGYVKNGQYNFYWNTYKRDDILEYNSVIGIQNNVMTFARVIMNRISKLGEVLESLGKPSDIRLVEQFGFFSLT